MNDIDKIKAYAKRKAKEFEIYFVESDTLKAEVNNGDVDFVSDNKLKGFGIRIARKGKIGFSFTTNIAKFRDCVDYALKLAKVSERDPYFESFAPRKPFKNLKSAFDCMLDFDASDFCDFNSDFVEQVKSVKRGINISGGTYRKNVVYRRVINSEGVDADDMSADNVLFYDLSFSYRGKLESLPVSYCSKRPFDSAIGAEAAERFSRTWGKRSARSGSMQAVFHPDALGELMDYSFVFNINADNVQRGKSRFRDMLGEKIFDSKLTIYDDGFNPKFYMSRSFDCEGSPTQKTSVVERGMLKSFLYDSYTAMRDGVDSTGNAHRYLGSVPAIDSNNIIISPGRSRNPVSDIDKGLYIRSLLGCHTMDNATGDFSLGVMEGFYVEKGEIKFPLKDAMVAGNLFDMMKDVVSVGRKIIHSPAGNGGCYMPEITFSNVKLIGGK